MFKQVLSGPGLCIPDEKEKECVKCLSLFHSKTYLFHNTVERVELLDHILIRTVLFLGGKKLCMFSYFLIRGVIRCIFLISLWNYMWGTSNEYPQDMCLWRKKKNINTFWLKKVPYLQLCMFTTFSRDDGWVPANGTDAADGRTQTTVNAATTPPAAKTRHATATTTTGICAHLYWP